MIKMNSFLNQRHGFRSAPQKLLVPLLVLGLFFGNFEPVFGQDLRPIYHVTAPQGWLGDPCGFVYHQGEYHICYQWTPNSTTADFGGMYWGHAVSTDLVHWSNLQYELAPDGFGSCWDGSTVVDFNNSAGFGVNTLITIYTATGYGFVQNMATSTDLGRTWAKYGGNPVLPTVVTGNHDPCVFWYPPGNKWVMVLYLSNNDYGIFSSTDLKHWTQTSTFTFPGVIEVPQLFQMPLDGNSNNLKWIFYAGAGSYYVGSFDGNSFSVQNGPFSIRGGNSFAAAPVFNNMPTYDGRKILIANGTQNYPNQPFQSAMDFPVELILATVGGTPKLCVNPVREIALLHGGTKTWPAQPLTNGVDLMAGTTAEAYELDVKFQPATAVRITFTLAGQQIIYNNLTHQISCLGITQTLNPIGGVVHLRVLVDRGTLEIFGNDGVLYMPMTMAPVAGVQPLSMVTSVPNGAQLLSMNLFYLTTTPVHASSIARWNMNPTGMNNPAVADVLSSDQAQNLWAFNGLGDIYPISTNTPPASMFANGNSGGGYSFNAAAFTNVDGALFYPQNVYGNSFSFTGSFTVELFFKSTGNQSGAGSMELLMQGENVFRYGLVVNEAGPGSVRFALNDGQGNFPTADLTARNYADGNWHYLLATYNQAEGTNGNLALTIVNQDGTSDKTNVAIGVFAGLPAGNDGNLFIGRYRYPVTQDHRTFRGLIDEVQITSGITSGSARLGALPPDTNGITRWSMSSAGANTPATLDSLREQDLWTFNGLNNSFPVSSDTPPPSMFANGNSGGNYSFNAAAFNGVDGALFYPQNVFGNTFAFTNQFTVELFFKSTGDQSGAGSMELLMQGENVFRYGLVANEAGPGSVRFALNDGQGNFPLADLNARNYADGAWHYLLAAYDPNGGTNGTIRLTILNQDESCDTTNVFIGTFAGLPSGNDGNLFVGRYRYPIAQDHRTFQGLIDEVQISNSSLVGGQCLGALPPIPQPRISAMTRTNGSFSFSWNSANWSNYQVFYASNLLGPWSVISTLPATGSMTRYQDTNAVRLLGPSGFYQVRIQ